MRQIQAESRKTESKIRKYKQLIMNISQFLNIPNVFFSFNINTDVKMLHEWNLNENPPMLNQDVPLWLIYITESELNSHVDFTACSDGFYKNQHVYHVCMCAFGCCGNVADAGPAGTMLPSNSWAMRVEERSVGVGRGVGGGSSEDTRTFTKTPSSPATKTGSTRGKFLPG